MLFQCLDRHCAVFISVCIVGVRLNWNNVFKYKRVFYISKSIRPFVKITIYYLRNNVKINKLCMYYYCIKIDFFFYANN